MFSTNSRTRSLKLFRLLTPNKICELKKNIKKSGGRKILCEEGEEMEMNCGCLDFFRETLKAMKFKLFSPH